MNHSWIDAMNQPDAEIEIILPSLKLGEPSRSRIYFYISKEPPISTEPNLECELVVHVVDEFNEAATTIPVFKGESIFAVMIRGLEAINEARQELVLGF